MSKKRIRGIICVILGGLGLLNWIADGMPLYSGSYGIGQKMGLAIFLMLFLNGLYVLIKTPKDAKNKTQDEPNK